MKSSININALSEVLATVLQERPDLVKMISGSKAAGTTPAPEKSKRMTLKQHREEAIRRFNKKHLAQEAKKNRANK